jgi:two-component system, NarL family, nitrate/nitrite response regulator NarL
MRVVLVGSESDRARLRARMNGSMTVVGEFTSLSSARASGLDSEAILLAPTEEASVPVTSDFSRTEALTPREVEVLELLAEGLPNKAIAARLRVSDQTVKFHVAAISGKLGAANRTDAVRRAVRRGLITF